MLVRRVSDETRTKPGGWLADRAAPSRDDSPPALAIAWSLAEPDRIGEVALPPPLGKSAVLGRGDRANDDRDERIVFRPLRPGGSPALAPLAAPGLSRRQLVVSASGGGLALEKVGRVAMRVNGRAIDRAVVHTGDVVVLEEELVLLVVDAAPGAFAGGTRPDFAFGEPDAFGVVGESPRAWTLRDDIAFYARREGHVLVSGPSGAGKELAARALHALSSRASGPFVARNAATLPAGIIDAELFGNAKNYPNAGMRERAGLVGEADGGTLFLDEIGELPEALQSHLLRVLDAGEYHRLGEDRPRRADVRLIAATNRDEANLKHDLLARLKLRLAVPGLEERMSDVPLLAIAALRRMGASDPAIRERFFEPGARPSPRIEPDLVVALLEHAFTTHARELETLLVLAMAGSREHFIALTADVRARLKSTRAAEPPTREQIEQALERCQGSVSRAWSELGLPSRDALNRLIKKHGIVVKRPRD
jgi:two-component system nitrogen regulation response regulator GlnG/two-component system response regulator HydG